MRVGFDISQIAHGGGVAVYTDELSKRLSKLKDLDMVFFYSLLRKTYKGSLANVKKFPIPPTITEALFNQWRFIPIEKFIGEIDVFHSNDWAQPPTKAKKITTMHDLVPILFPQWSHPKIIEVHKRRLNIVEREIDLVIAVSNSTKEDVCKLTSLERDKIVVIYEGVDKIFTPQNEKDEVEFKKKNNLPDKFVLAVGGVGERKNLKRIKEASKNYNLIILGRDIKKLKREELPLLYSSASILVYASLYEGFGLPIVEAMACGTPVITSDRSSMPEIGGEAAEYVNPENVEEISSKIKLVLEDRDLREKMRREGIEQARKFDWDKCARETAQVYRRVLE
ncbi:glycosyltransferase family 4 protein [Candidatus Daviesbacteria bacterium]|nr:glycosyltransferase family 4 protein [Candidatus Daviesbacteria bacterium]